MKNIHLLLLLLLVACSPAGTGESLQPLSTQINKIQPTQYIAEIPTVNYEATIAVKNQAIENAVSTTNAIMALQVQATASKEQINQENIRYTHEADLRTALQNAVTLTAAPTSVYLTKVQQDALNTQIPVQQGLLSGQLTSTSEAPKNALLVSQVENNRKYGFLEYFMKYIVTVSVVFFLVTFGVWFLRRPVEKVVYKERIHYKEPETQFIVPIADYANDLPSNKPLEQAIASAKSSGAYPSEIKYQFPCTPEQLDELAEKVITKGIGLGYDNFAGKDSLFTRETYAPVYSFLLDRKLAKSTGIKNKGIILTDRDFGEINGVDLLTGWLESRVLPEPFTYTAPLSDVNSPESCTSEGENARVPEARVQEGGDLLPLRGKAAQEGK